MEGQEQNQDLENELFNINPEVYEEDINPALYEGMEEDITDKPQAINTDDGDDGDSGAGSDGDDSSDDFNFENTDDQDAEIDVQAFNKKFGKNFKDEAELKAFLEDKEEVQEEQKFQEEFENATKVVEQVKPLLELNNEDLLMRKINYDLMQKGKDLSDQDVQLEAQEIYESYVDTNQVDLRATQIRNSLKEPLAKAESSIQAHNNRLEANRIAKEKEDKQKLQNEFVNLYGDGNFYGVAIEKKNIGEAYQSVTSGKFENEVLKDKGAMAELALLWYNRKQIYGKATGAKYSDGVKAVMDEFTNASENNDAKSRLRQSGSSDSALSLTESLAQ